MTAIVPVCPSCPRWMVNLEAGRLQARWSCPIHGDGAPRWMGRRQAKRLTVKQSGQAMTIDPTANKALWEGE